MRKYAAAVLVLFLAAMLPAQKDSEFKRERRGGPRDAPKDALEGKAPPALQVSGWMNAPKGGLDLAKLNGKVIVLDFWGVW